MPLVCAENGKRKCFVGRVSCQSEDTPVTQREEGINAGRGASACHVCRIKLSRSACHVWQLPLIIHSSAWQMSLCSPTKRHTHIHTHKQYGSSKHTEWHASAACTIISVMLYISFEQHWWKALTHILIQAEPMCGRITGILDIIMSVWPIFYMNFPSYSPTVPGTGQMCGVFFNIRSRMMNTSFILYLFNFRMK